MADHLFRKFWGSWGSVALTVAVLAYPLIAPVRARADSPVASAASLASTAVPAAAQAAVSAALAQASSAGAASSAVAIPVPPAPVSPPPAPLPPPASVPSSPAGASAVSQPANPAGVVPAAAPATSGPPSDASAGAPATVGQGATPATPAPDGRRISTPGQAAGQRTAHSTTRRHTLRPGRAGPPRAVRHPVAGVSAAARAPVWSPAPGFSLPPRRDVRPAGALRRNAPSESAGRPRRGARPRVDAASTAPPMQLPASPALPPAGAEGATAGGAGGAAGTAAAALLTLAGLCFMRALLPGLLALELGPWRSALLVCQLERPG